MSILADLKIVATGCTIVLGALVLLWALTAALGRLVAFGHGLGRSRPAAVAAEGIPAHHLVAIAAAVEATLGEGHRIAGIAAPAHRVPGWASSARYPQSHRRPALGGSLHERTDGS
ncbi:hypothetical protein [Shumkonia mesophila]|uniref:hypothetical protein n=1 Tax=Shumkonia mesophila TaxID=2838854 RepID=UPI00293445AB|nr:hypothetical protein [Shumkonia mesophila]